MICTPCAQNMAHRPYVQSLITQAFLHPDRLAQYEKYDLAINLIGGVSGLGKDRGTMASTALRMGFDKVMFIDADQSWTWPQLKTILDSDKPIVGGIVALKQFPIQLNFTPRDEDKRFFEPENVATYKGIQRMAEAAPNTSEFEVKQMGTGFLSIDCEVLKSLAKTEVPHFKDVVVVDWVRTQTTSWDFFQTGVLDGIYHGEDWSFCTIAARKGYKTFININVQIPHHGTHEYRVNQELTSREPGADLTRE